MKNKIVQFIGTPINCASTVTPPIENLAGQVSFTEIETDKGHDSFLLEEPELDFVIKGFLESNFETNE